MTIKETIARYLAARKTQGLHVSAVETIDGALHTVFESVLAEHIAILTADQIDALHARLGRRGVRQAGPILGSTRDLLWSTTRAFLTWCVQQRLLTNDPLAPRTAKHIGELARQLRQEAGLYRRDLANQTGLSLTTIRLFEINRIKLRRGQLLRLLQHPGMASLPEKAKAAGLDLGLGNNGVGKHDPSAV